MPVLRKFCCCCTLKTGSVIYGWIGLVGAIFNIATTSTVLANLDILAVKYSNTQYAFQSVFSGELAASVVFLVSFALLIIGAIKENRYLLLPWLISGMVGIIGFVLIIVILGPVLLASETYVLFGVLVFSLGIPLCALDVYIWLCVFSLFQYLRDLKNCSHSRGEAPQSVGDVVQGYNPPSYEKLESHLNV